MTTDTPIYNTIGKGYNNTRTADPNIAKQLHQLLQPSKEGTYLDIGCGTGNYLKALSDMGVSFTGADPSDTMLQEAKQKNPNANLVKAKAEDLPFDNDSFDGGMGNFTLHHWDNIQKGLNEIYRILKPGGRFIFFSFTPQQLYGYWLHHYFPEMIRISSEVIPNEKFMKEMLLNAGFSAIETEKYFVPERLQDQFLYANKHHPEKYLLPEVRSGASSFRIYSIQEEVELGLKKLEKDIETGAITSVMQQYENDLGDYLFYIVEK